LSFRLPRPAVLFLALSLWGGARAFDAPPSSAIKATGTVEVAFSPWDDPEAALIRLIQSAKRSIRIQAYLFTSRPLARALLDAHSRGVAVEVLADAEQTARGDNSQIPLLAMAGIPVHVEVRYAAAHNKILIVDAELPGAAVATGSFNFTYSAQARNAENLLILRGNRKLVRTYLDNWQRHRLDAVPYAEAVLTK
jgi:phosphatidylserine/phosphatidylglycerophosphate/cardiolipin synthase-like enzyme